MPTDGRTCLLRPRPCFHRMRESEVAFMDRFKVDADGRGGRLTVPDREALATVATAPEAGRRVRPIL